MKENPATSATVRGSSAMSRIGQLPGAGWSGRSFGGIDEAARVAAVPIVAAITPAIREGDGRVRSGLHHRVPVTQLAGRRVVIVRIAVMWLATRVEDPRVDGHIVDGMHGHRRRE